MTGWRDLASRLLAEEVAEKGGAAPAPAPASPIAADPALPPDLVSGLRLLSNLPAPRKLANKSAWAEVVSDALRLEREGWVARALELGWQPRDLFGIGERSSLGFEGLAVWLAGRRVLLVDDRSAMVLDGEWRRIFHRPSLRADVKSRVVPLWRFGRDG